MPPMADSHVLRLCSEVHYLGLYFVAGYVLRCNFYGAKAKYFGSLNSLLGKLYCENSNINNNNNTCSDKCRWLEFLDKSDWY